MSQRSNPAPAEAFVALGATGARLESYPSRETLLGSLEITRALPVRGRRLIGPWCFLDRFGPLSFTEGKPMDVAPHPHMGLQTVTWLFDGEVMHDDSLGNESLLRPGGVNVMTSGDAISHAEQTPRDHTGRLNGVQLWTALPDSERRRAAGFVHVGDVPAVEPAGGVVKVFAGSLPGATSPAPYYSPILGADVRVHPGMALELPLDAAFEHAVLVLDGDAALDGESLVERQLYYLGTSRTDVAVSSRSGGHVLLVGGPPFPETILMWWNFVGRTQEEIAEAREDWEAGRRFGAVKAYEGPRLDAPRLVRFARPNPMS